MPAYYNLLIRCKVIYKYMDSLTGKKILFVITKSNWGGAQAYVYQLATYCASQGANVVVALGGTGLPGAALGLLAERLTAANIRIITLPSFARDISITREFKAFKEMYEVVRREHADIVHVNSSKAGGIGTLAARLLSVKKIVFTAHGWPHNEPRSLLARILIWLSSWATVSLSTNTIVLSELDYKGAPVFLSRRKLSIIRNGVSNFSLLTKEEARKVLATTKDIPLTSEWILMQSELHKNKSVDVAIKAFSEIAPKYPNAVLIVMGEGEERNRLETLITQRGLGDRVFLLGFVANSREYLRAGSIFLMSSQKEGMPLALLEASFAELPIVSTNVGAIPEIIQQGVTGLLVPPEDAQALAIALSSLLDDPELAKRLGSAFREYSAVQLSAEKMLGKTLALYTEKK